ERLIREFPIVAAGAEISLMQRRAVAQIVEPELLDAIEVELPMLVMAARLHLVDAGPAAVDGRDAGLDPGREHEAGDDPSPLTCRNVRSAAQPFRSASAIKAMTSAISAVIPALARSGSRASIA